ncbi:hypothetical protein [Halopseudomonas pelagia]|uniref:hypothetical protein n=1 Tax=Halopseudomonas pelagia TaxID=553151 RepID=UPI0003A199C9|nr:hypothetical protein [Halopseudomonas pelagia]|tara:strand:+ start:228 stop:914 length:687 start_codon:yes stop_codon:yes gene_type:complete
MQAHLATWWLWMPASLMLTACGLNMPRSEQSPARVERTLVSHSIQMDAGDVAVMSLPQRTLRVQQQLHYDVTEFNARGGVIDRREEHQTLPWANKPVDVIAGSFRTSLNTDTDGLLRLNLLNDGFLNLDYDNLRVIQLTASASPKIRSEVNLLIGRELRSKLHEAVDLIYGNLEEDDVDQWAYRVHRLSALGLSEESNQLENMLILLTTGDPQLQGEFMHALDVNQRP